MEFYHDTDTDRQRYKCECGCRFDYLTGTVFDGRHQAITISIMAMYHTGLNFSNAQVARELDLNVCDVHDMRTAIRDAVCQKKPSPILKDHIESGAVFNMDEYCIYDRVNDWGYQHKIFCHAAGEYARDEDGDGFHEVYVNTIEGFGLPLALGFPLIWAFNRKGWR